MPRHATVLAFLAVMAGITSGCGRPGDREFTSGMRELDAGRNVKARDLFERSILLRPGSALNAQAYNGLGVACWRLENVPEAVKAFEESRRLNPDLPEAPYNLAVILHRGGDVLRASALLEESAMIDPTDPRALEYLGRIYFEQGRWSDARVRWQAALERAPGSARILAALGTAELRLGGPQAAVLWLMKSLEADEHYAPALHNLFVIHDRALGRPDQAEVFARRFLREAPKDPRAEAVDRWLDARTDARPPAAPAAPTSTVSVTRPPPAPREPAPAPPDPEKLLAEAQHAAREGAPRKGFALCLQAAEQARLAGNATLRERALRRAADLNFDYAPAYLALGRFLLETKRYDSAAQAYQQALSLSPELGEAHAGLAEAAVKTGEFDTAVVSLRKVVQQQPGNPDAQWMLAVLYDETLGLKVDAIREYRAFTRRFPQDVRTVRAGERLREMEKTPPAPPSPAAPTNAPAPTPPAPPPPAAAGRAATPSPPAPAAPPMPAITGRRLELKPAGRTDREAALQAFQRGIQQQQQRDFDRAAYEYRRSLELDPKQPLAFFNLGNVYRETGDLDLAKHAYVQSLSLDPEYAAARYNLSLVLDGLREDAAALAHLEYLVIRQSDYAPAHYLLGLICSRDERFRPRARTHLQQFLKLSPTDSNAATVKQWLAQHP